MIVSQIRKVKGAEERLKMAKADLASLSFGCQSHPFCYSGNRGSDSDPTAKAVMKKEMLEARARLAETCCKQEQEVLSNMLLAIGDETIAKLLLDRYYYELKNYVYRAFRGTCYHVAGEHNPMCGEAVIRRFPTHRVLLL